METKGAIIVYLTRFQDAICVKTTEPRGEKDIISKNRELFFTIPEANSRSEVVRRFRFRRIPGPEHFYSYKSLLCNAHLKPDEEHDYRMLVEIPIKNELPFVDLLELGTIAGNTVYALWSNMAVQIDPDFSDRMFFSIENLDVLHESNPQLGVLVEEGILKYRINAM